MGLKMHACVLMGACATATLALGQPTLGTALGAASVASINYWRCPGPGRRPDGDFAIAIALFLYYTLASQSLSGLPNYCACGCFGGFFLCFRRSFLLSVGDGGNGAWARWHALGHGIVAMASLSLAAGNVDGWLAEPLPLIRPRRNPLGAATLSLAAISCVYEGLRALMGGGR